MSLKGIKSRLRQTARTETDRASPSRTSFFHQLSTFLSSDESNKPNKGESIHEDVANYFEEDQFLVLANGGGASAKVETDASGSTDHLDFSETVLEPTTNSQSQQSTASASPVGQDRVMAHSLVAKDSFDLAGSDRETDKDSSSVGEDDRWRRPIVNSLSIRRRVLHSAGSSVEQPMNSSPGTPRRNRFASRDKRRSERSISLDRSVRCGGNSSSIQPSLEDPLLSPTQSTNAGNEETFVEDGAGGCADETSCRLPQNRITAWARELMDDLQSIEDADQTNSNKDNAEDLGDSLAVKRLKTNILRFGRITSTISSCCDSIQSLRQWESPTASILFILVSSYAIWHGLFLAFIIATSLFKLTMNYLMTEGWIRHFGWSPGFEYQQDADETSSGDGNKSSTSVKEKLAVLLQVARKVQNQLGAVCDAVEKIKNLLMWRHEATRRLYAILWLLLSLCLVIPAPQLSTFFGFYLLVKLMVIDFIFFKFPRLRAKYDTSSLVWETLPTDADLNARQKVEQGLRNTATSGDGLETKTFCESFNLPTNEQPLPGWQTGLRSTLVNRDKSLTSTFKSGRLFLTASYLCFERSKTQPGKNVVIPLDRITRLEKGNQYTWIPGGGMIIEVFVQGLDRAYTFGAIMNRDDVFIAIRTAAEKQGCVWRQDKSAPS